MLEGAEKDGGNSMAPSASFPLKLLQSCWVYSSREKLEISPHLDLYNP